jgi:hypothetical protein
MKPHVNDVQERAAQKKVVRKYTSLGYDVLENPGPDVLPEFMRGMEPDIVARSSADNVVIEVKTHASLKGSNDLVGIAERVAGHADWRLELVVPDDIRDVEDTSHVDYDKLLEMVRVAVANQLFDMAFVYLATILMQMGRHLAKRSNIPSGNKADRGVFLELGFKGVLPDALLEQCLTVLARRAELVHGERQMASTTDQEVQTVLHLVEVVRALL